ncbi:MAG: two-component regulator propeller domain-containing protein [Paludibacter sp.]|nr:two-component regulator propeller domain-containing protein [Paludibacter sp.]
MKKSFILLLTILLSFTGEAQFHFSFSHYTSDNGLSQNGITAMMKDSKGYMWFGTRDGLNKFDGYNFTIYNSKPDQRQTVLSNRILVIKEDNWGYIWIKTYDDFVYRLNPSTEEFSRISLPDQKQSNIKINELFFLRSGEIWLSTYNNGCLRITTDPSTHQLTIKYLDKKQNLLPHDVVHDIFEDFDKQVWILTEGGITYMDNSGKSLFYNEKQTFYTHVESEKRILFGSKGKIIHYEKRNRNFLTIDLPKQVVVSKMINYSTGNYLFITENSGFFTYDVIRDQLQHYAHEKYPEMTTNVIRDVHMDKAGEIWLGIKSQGVLHFNTLSKKISYIPTKINEGQITNPNYLIFEDEKDVLWIQPYFGTFSWFDRASGKLVPFYSAYNEDINVLFSYGVNHVLSDSQGVLWISTNRGNGFFKCTFLPDYFNHYLLQDNSVYSITNETRAIFEDDEKRLWVATKDGTVHVYNENKKLIGSLHTDGTIKLGGRKEMFVYNIFQDKSGDIWVSTKRQGLFRLKKKNAKNAFSIENFVHKPGDPYSPAHNDFYSVTQDKSGRIWAGTYGGGLHLLEEKNGKVRFIHAYNELKNYPIANCSRVRQVFADSKDQIWVATTEGFVLFDSKFDDFRNIRFDYYNNNENRVNGLGANDVHCIYESQESEIWFGTFGGGLNRLINKKGDKNFPEFQIFDRSTGIPNNVVYTIIDDKQGSLWLTTDNSIVKLNKKTYEFEVFGKGNELENVEFSEASAFRLQSGEICLGSKSGFYVFRPEAVIRKKIDAPLVFTKLILFNQEVVIGEKSLLKSQLDKTEEIVFNHRQNVFTIEFATLDMRAPDKIHYAYKLEGFDKDWNYVRNKHFATYTSLPPGDYKFYVKSTDSEGIWLDNQRIIKLKMLPSFWQSGFARFLYVVFVLLIFGITLMIFLTIYKLKHNVQIEKQMTDMKLRFFTDISHELRTPLTLISLPVDNLLQEDLDAGIKEQLTFVRRNLDRVLGLINQILDFRKLQNNKMRLTVEEVNFGEFVKNSANNFTETAHAKKIKFKIVDETDNLRIWLDPERFDSIIYNLLSNAFKFTSSGKSITVKTSLKQNMAVLSVIDEGVGIAQEKINFIFDRFFSVSTLRNIAQRSTGIGLDLVKKLVDLHHAVIHVESQVGKGSTFEIEFKQGVNHFADDVDIIMSDNNQSIGENDDQLEIVNTDENNDQAHHSNVIPLILVVEDNDELRHFLRNSLKNNYRVEEAENGLTGWKKIELLMPDFIIADLRMPEMDGLQLINKIKEDKRTSHIPVILLTAVTDMESKLAGMKAGADDYITKPFSSAFLHARIENLMKQRTQLQQFYRSQMLSPRPDFSLPPLEISSQEELFMKKLIKLMNDNLDNYDLNIDYLASELGMSRTVFFNKLKSLTGFSPVEFVREIRFERAAEYMRNTQYTVSEISYRVGIEDPRYFSRCFKQKFGTTPSEYRQKHQEQPIEN